MKRRYAVTVLVEAEGDTERDFWDALGCLLNERVLYVDLFSASPESTYSLKSIRTLSVRRRKP